MKKKLVFLSLMFVGLLLPQNIHAQTAKAIWCKGNTTLYFNYDDVDYYDYYEYYEGIYDGQTITDIYRVSENIAAEASGIPWRSIQSSVTRVVISSTFSNFQPQSLKSWFYNFKKVKTIDGLKYINTSNVTDMQSTFSGCSSLTSLAGVEGWNTSNVEGMSQTFRNCTSLTSLEPLKKWNTSNVTDMFYTFKDCTSLTSLEPISGWKTGNVTSMTGTFYGCSGLTSLEPLKKWNTSNVTDMQSTFNGCSSLTSLEPIKDWVTSNVTDMVYTFKDCTSLTSLEPISGWKTGNVTSMTGTFYGCSGLTSLEPLKKWNTSSVKRMDYTFHGCTGLTSLEPLKKWNTSNVEGMSQTFRNCTSLTSLAGLENWNTSNVEDMSQTFRNCTSLTSLAGLENWNISYNKKLYYTFAGCSGITSLEPLKKWNTRNVTDMGYIFMDCTGLLYVNMADWYNWYTSSKVTAVAGMFYRCTNLRYISFGKNFNMNTVPISESGNMFRNCNKLRYIDFYNSRYATSGTDMQFPLNTVNRSSGVFNGVPETTVIFLPKGNGSVTDVTNVVYSNDGDASDLRCPKYYSTDKVDIEFPRQFKTKEAVYSRTMGSKEYGSVVLPYAFTTNSDIQAYSLSKQNDGMTRLTFTNAKTIPAHTPFAFKRLNNAEFLMKNSNFGITVNATRSTNANEMTWTEDAPTEAPGTPYVGTTGLSNWKTKGYYVAETVTDYDGMYFIQDNNFKRATGNLNLVDHRVLFYPTGAPGASKFFTLSFSDDEMITAIEAAETEQTLRQAEGIYDATGRQQVTTRRGLNIVRMSDGTVKKVVVK